MQLHYRLRKIGYCSIGLTIMKQHKFMDKGIDYVFKSLPNIDTVHVNNVSTVELSGNQVFLRGYSGGMQDVESVHEYETTKERDDMFAVISMALEFTLEYKDGFVDHIVADVESKYKMIVVN